MDDMSNFYNFYSWEFVYLQRVMIKPGHSLMLAHAVRESHRLFEIKICVCCVTGLGPGGRWNNLTFYHPTWEMCHYKICLNSHYFGDCLEMTTFV